MLCEGTRRARSAGGGFLGGTLSLPRKKGYKEALEFWRTPRCLLLSDSASSFLNPAFEHCLLVFNPHRGAAEQRVWSRVPCGTLSERPNVRVRAAAVNKCFARGPQGALRRGRLSWGYTFFAAKERVQATLDFRLMTFSLPSPSSFAC